MLECSRTGRAEFIQKAYVLTKSFVDSTGEAAGCILSYHDYKTLQRRMGTTTCSSTSIDQYLSDLEADGKNPYMGKEAEISQEYQSALIVKKNLDKRNLF